MLIQILVAMVCCLLAYGVSHISWVQRKKKEGANAIPMFWERPFITLMMLVIVYKITSWPGDMFALFMMSWYILFLSLYTWYIYHTHIRPINQARKIQEQKKS